jgi:hypothetical protein
MGAHEVTGTEGGEKKEDLDVKPGAYVVVGSYEKATDEVGKQV